jgi:hypothetical protein
MENVVECFGTHKLMESFIREASKRHGQDVNVPVFGDAARNDQNITLRFPLTQRTRFRAIRLVAVTRAYSGFPLYQPVITMDSIKPFASLAVSLESAKFSDGIADATVPPLSLTANPAASYSLWKEKFTDFLSIYRSAHTGAPLSYLVRETEEPSILDVQEFESLDLYLISTLSLDPDVNLGFAAENKVLASALNKALGTSNLWANDLGTLIGKGQGQLAWECLKVRVNGTAQASSA